MKQINSHLFPEVYKQLGLNLSKLGCVMLDLKALDNMYSIAVEGAEVSLYYSKNKHRFWIDGWVADKLHVTLLYGLLREAEDYGVHIDKVLGDWWLDEVEIEDVSYFDSPYEDEPYYCIVLKLKVTSELLEGHQRLELLPHINTFAGYKPHATLCYIKRDQGEEYRDNMIKWFKKLWVGKKLKPTKLNFGGNVKL